MKHAAAALFLFVALGTASGQQAKVPPPKPKSRAEVLALIEAETGLPVLDMPKMQEFFIGLRLAA